MSRRLMALGLDTETADMHWQTFEGKDKSGKDVTATILFEKHVDNEGAVEDVPAWSLSALLEVVEEDYYPELFHDGEAWELQCRHHDRNWETYISKVYSRYPLSAAYDAVTQMLEHGKLKGKEGEK